MKDNICKIFHSSILQKKLSGKSKGINNVSWIKNKQLASIIIVYNNLNYVYHKNLDSYCDCEEICVFNSCFFIYTKGITQSENN